MPNNIKVEFEELNKEVREYIDIRVDLAKLNAAEQLSRFFSGLMVKLLIFFLLFVVTIFLLIALAIFLGKITESNELGFLIVALIYLIAALSVLALKKQIIERPVIKSFIKLFFPQKEE